MRNYLILLLSILFISCTNNSSDRYIKVAEGEGVNPKYNKKFDVLEQKVVVLIDNKTSEVIYYDVWEEKIISKRSLKDDY